MQWKTPALELRRQQEHKTVSTMDLRFRLARGGWHTTTSESSGGAYDRNPREGLPERRNRRGRERQ